MITLRIKHIFATLMLTTTSACAAQPELSSAAGLANLDNVVNAALQTFYTPGMAVGIIKNGEVVYLDGAGQRQLDPALPVNADTYFRLASTSKAFTAAALAMAIEDFELSWDTRVTDILPGFQMQDAWVTREFTLMDLLVHRSGLASGAGDSMLWPEPSGFSREEIIHNLRYLTPVSSFRSAYAYSNLMYITAGEVVAKLYQKPFAEVINDKIFAPLDMQCFAGDQTDAALNNVALSYGHNDERGIYAIPRNGIQGSELVSAAAGGIVCNASGMLKWLQMWLNKGTGQNGAQILTPEQVETIHKARTVLSVSDTDDEWDDTLFKAYGLGWRLADVHGYQVISHTGTLSGYQAYVAMVPKLHLAVVLLNNGSNYGARSAVMQHILKSYIAPQETTDWVQTLKEYQAEREQRYLANLDVPEGIGEVVLDPLAYSGEFTDTWYGTMQITLNQAGQLRLSSDKMTMLTGTLEPFSDHTFVIRWDNQNAASDAFMHFDVNPARQVTGFKFHPFTYKEKLSHNFSDTYFTRSE
ncbi:serine hydrolase [Alteromonas gilva]|uniref:Serine hydrolase n=1 Tax=Alteromonas gilva TaxID=2987522 RepID=A0ABT5L1L1_9ALTE|nr:serine hydrolase [Alteromonas gilva]MDC8830304.1 serine hydrolase [Alteromonas gilva]